MEIVYALAAIGGITVGGLTLVAVCCVAMHAAGSRTPETELEDELHRSGTIR